MTRRTMLRLNVILLAALSVGAGIYIAHQHFFRPHLISAIFTSASGIYPGDVVRVAGVEVGTVTSIQPQGPTVMMTMKINHNVPIPADAKAVIAQQNLVAQRYVQMTPAYETTGPRMPDGAVIPVERTVVPVEWDDVKAQLMRLATDLGPKNDTSSTSTGRFINSAANALEGNGGKLRETLAQLSAVARIFRDGGSNIVEIIKNLQTFVTVLRDSNQQIVEFESRLATLTGVLDGSRSALDGALRTLAVAIADVQRFITGIHGRTTEQVQRLANVTTTLVEQKKGLEQLLHVIPTTLSNFLNLYDQVAGTATGVLSMNNFSNPAQFVCGAIAGVQGGNLMDSAKKCAEYLGPYLRLLSFNYLPVPLNPVLAPTPRPDQIVYSEPDLIPPGVVGAQDAAPAPAPSVPDMLLPAERPRS